MVVWSDFAGDCNNTAMKCAHTDGVCKFMNSPVCMCMLYNMFIMYTRAKRVFLNNLPMYAERCEFVCHLQMHSVYTNILNCLYPQLEQCVGEQRADMKHTHAHTLTNSTRSNTRTPDEWICASGLVVKVKLKAMNAALQCMSPCLVCLGMCVECVSVSVCVCASLWADGLLAIRVLQLRCCSCALVLALSCANVSKRAHYWYSTLLNIYS